MIQDKLTEAARHYQSKGISFIAISSNDVETHPQDGPEEMKKEAPGSEILCNLLSHLFQIFKRLYNSNLGIEDFDFLVTI